MSKVLVPLANGCEELEVVSIVDVLRRGGVEVVTASVHDSLAIAGAHGMSFKADARLTDVEDGEYDAVILPGGGEGTENLKRSEAVTGILRRQMGAGRLVCAICAAPTVLVEAGILDENQEITCYPACQTELDRTWVDRPVVVHGNVITGQAPGSALLFGLVILQALEGQTVARKVARGMVADVLI